MRIYAYFKKSDGFTLVYSVLMMILVLVFIAVLVNLAVIEYSQAEKNKNATKAYFLARSGAEVMAGYINENDDDAITKIDSYIAAGETLELKNDTEKISDIKIVKNSEYSYDIISTAEVKGESKSIIALLEKTIPDFTDVAIFAKSDLDFSKMDYLDVAAGKVVTNGKTINDPDNFIKEDEQKIIDANLEFPQIIWDENDVIQDLIDAEPGGKKIVGNKISSSGYYKNIRYNNGTLEIEFPEDEDELNIAVEDFTLKSDMIFSNYDPDAENPKVLNIYVKDSITFQTPNVDLPNINFFLNQDSEMTLIANSDLPDDGGIFVYGPDSNFKMQSNKTSFGGAIIVDSFEGQGNLAMGNFIYEAFTYDEIEYIKNIIRLNAKYKIVSWNRN